MRHLFASTESNENWRDLNFLNGLCGACRIHSQIFMKNGKEFSNIFVVERRAIIVSFPVMNSSIDSLGR